MRVGVRVRVRVGVGVGVRVGVGVGVGVGVCVCVFVSVFVPVFVEHLKCIAYNVCFLRNSFMSYCVITNASAVQRKAALRASSCKVI